MTEKGKSFVAESIAPLREAERRAFIRMDALAQKQYVALSQEYAANLQEELEGCFAVPESGNAFANQNKTEGSS